MDCNSNKATPGGDTQGPKGSNGDRMLLLLLLLPPPPAAAVCYELLYEMHVEAAATLLHCYSCCC